MPAPSLSYREACALIEARGPSILPDLSRMQRLTDLLDHPERTYPSVQVAGTNGKSSTSRMIGAILAAHGLNVGVYTSPHLQSVRERFILAGPAEDAAAGDVPAVEYIAAEEFAAVLEYLVPFLDLVGTAGPAAEPGAPPGAGERPSSFEILTAMAFEWMANHTVGAGVFEAGLGGSWDATNVVAGDVGVLTHIAVDHIAMLGATPLLNAREKVGIIKPGARVICAAQDPDVADLVARTAAGQGATLVVAGEDFRLRANDPALGGRLVTVEGPEGGVYEDIYVPLLGAHQGRNAELAMAAAEALLGRGLDPDSVAAGFRAVRSPGRLEVVSRDPFIVLDGAHNPEAASLLGPALLGAFGARPGIFVISILADKDIPGVLAPLLAYAAQMIFWPSSTPRAAPPERLADAAAALGFPTAALRVAESLADAVLAARLLAETEGMVVVTGSLLAVGEARDLLVGPVA